MALEWNDFTHDNFAISQYDIYDNDDFQTQHTMTLCIGTEIPPIIKNNGRRYIRNMIYLSLSLYIYILIRPLGPLF